MTKTQKWPVPWCEGGELPDGLLAAVVLEQLDVELASGHAEHRDLDPARLRDADDPPDLRLLVEPPPEQLEPEQAAVELERAVEV